MWHAEMKWRKFNDSLKEEDIRCVYCKYRFNENICVNHGSPVGYGGNVSDDFTCSDWEPDIYFFDDRLKEIEGEKKNIV